MKKICKQCKHPVEKRERICPSCGKPIGRIRIGVFFVLLLNVVMLIFAGYFCIQGYISITSEIEVQEEENSNRETNKDNNKGFLDQWKKPAQSTNTISDDASNNLSDNNSSNTETVDTTMNNSILQEATTPLTSEEDVYGSYLGNAVIVLEVGPGITEEEMSFFNAFKEMTICRFDIAKEDKMVIMQLKTADEVEFQTSNSLDLGMFTFDVMNSSILVNYTQEQFIELKGNLYIDEEGKTHMDGSVLLEMTNPEDANQWAKVSLDFHSMELNE